MVDTVPHTSHAPVRLVVADMDGTLLDGDGDGDGDGLVPDGFWPLLDRLSAAGIEPDAEDSSDPPPAFLDHITGATHWLTWDGKCPSQVSP